MRGEGAPPTIVAGVADPGLSAVALAKADAGLNPFDKLRAPSPSRGEAGYIFKVGREARPTAICPI